MTNPTNVDHNRPLLHYAGGQQLDEIHDASLEILERTGILAMHPYAIELLDSAGAFVERVDEGCARVRIPTFLVERCIASAPSRVSIANRDGRRQMILQGARSFYGTGSDLKYTLDLQTGERRQSVLQDVANAARLVDALPNIDFVMSHGLACDVPVEMQELAQYEAMLLNTTKPLILTTFTDLEVLVTMHEIACILAGTPSEFIRNPNLCIYGQFVSPFRHNFESLDKLLFCAEKRIPIIYIPTIMAGASGPVTLAGALAIGNAEVLAGLVIHQLKNSGAPFIYGGCIGPIDLRTTIFPYAAPEWHISDAILAQLSWRYGLPQFGTAGASDSKIVDEQAALEAAYTLMFASLSGVNLIHDVGYLESGLTASLDYLVICDEIISLIRPVLRGVDIDQDNLALDLIDKVGPGGQFIDSEHTRRHYREAWYPGILDRRSFQAWLDGGATSLKERARSKAMQLLETHPVPPLASEVARAIQDVMKIAWKRVKL
jgi:trimethylamine--corrinoid protein Co-methyltransferase